MSTSRDITVEEFRRLAERFAVAEDMIRLRDVARLWTRVGLVPMSVWSVELSTLEKRFDELDRATVARKPTVATTEIEWPEWVMA